MARPKQRFRVCLRRIMVTGLVGLVLLPALLIIPLRWLAPPTSSFMLQARFGGLGKAPACARVQQEWIPWEDIAEPPRLAVVAAEDQRFPHHWGFDFSAIGQALEDRMQGEALRGASTISQQVAKNLFLWPGRSLLRKGLEAYLTVWIELAWPKRRILEIYLNTAQFGPCTFGVAAAATRTFGHSASRLSWAQAARLAAVLPNPNAFDLRAPSPYLRERARWIEAQMQRLGGATYLDGLDRR